MKVELTPNPMSSRSAAFSCPHRKRRTMKNPSFLRQIQYTYKRTASISFRFCKPTERCKKRKDKELTYDMQ